MGISKSKICASFTAPARLALLAIFFTLHAQAQSLTIQGKVVDGSNNPVTGNATQFRVQILSPDSQRCVLFDETHTIDLTGTNGFFSINLNDGSVTANAPNTYTLEQALSNRAPFTINSTYCASGSGTLTYTPSQTDNRKVVIKFRDPGTMAAFETIPEMDINPVAWAMESRSVGGFPSSSLLRVVGAGVPGTAPSLTPSDITELQSLIGGTSSKYLGKDSSSGASLPSYAGNPLSPAAGSIWFDSSGSGALKFKDTSGTIQTLGTGGGGGTITNITAGAGLTGGGSSGSVSLALPTTGVTGFGSAVGSASAVPVITYDAYGRLTSVTTAAISGTLPSGTSGEFLKSGGGSTWASSSIKMGDLKNGAGTGSLFGTVNCSASQSMYWDSGADQIRCQNIALGDSQISDLAWSKITGAPSFVANGGSATSIVANSSGSKPAGQSAGRIYVDIANQKISYDNGTAWVDVSGSAAATPSVSVSAPLTSTSGTIGITQASVSTDGYLSSANFTTFTNKLSKALASAHIFVGNGGGDATDVAVSGDLSLANTGAFTVDAIKGTPISAVPSATGQVLRFDGANYSPTLLSLADIRSNVTGSTTFTTTCSASQTLTWNSGTDTLSCQNISLAAASQLSGIVPVANGGTGTSNGSITGTGALSFTAGGSNQNVSIAPSGTGYTLLGGKVGIGTTAPSSALSISVPEISSGRESLMTFRMTGDANTVSGIGNLTSANGAFGPMFFGYRPGNFDRMVTSFRGFTDSAGDVAGTENALVDISGVITDNNSDPINGNQWVPSNRNIFSVSSWDGPLMSVSPTGRVGIGSFTPSTSLDLSQKKDAVSLPRGTTAEAPAASRAGMIRWNTSNSALEVSNGSTWVNVLAGNAYSFSTGTSGNAPNWSNTGNAYTLNLPLASSGAGVTAGLLSNSEYAALATKASPTFTGTPAAPTAAADTNTTQLATTAFVVGQASSATPLVNSGAGAAGTSLKYSREDHVHPTDTSRAPAAGSTSITTLGTIGTGTWNGSAIGVAYGGTGTSSTSQGFVFAGPASGSGAPAFRALAATDLPASASYWQAATGGINFAGGSVGINTTTPAGKFNVVGTTFIDKDSAGDQLYLRGTTNSNQQMVLGYNTTSDYGMVQALLAGTSPKPLALNPSGGYVGIGTSAPLNTLDLGDSAPSITMGANSAIMGNLYFNGGWKYRSNGYGGYMKYNNAASNGGSFEIGMTSVNNASGTGTTATPSAVMNILPSGNVGIGSTAPAAALDVNGRIKSTMLRAQYSAATIWATSSTSWVDTDVVITGTTTGGPVMLNYTSQVGCSANGAFIGLRFTVDGTAVTSANMGNAMFQEGAANTNPYYQKMIGTQWLITSLAAGSHTFRVQAITAGGTCTLNEGGTESSERTLTAVEL